MFLFPLAYSPGPGNAFFAALGASKGLRAAIPALAGYHVATVVVTAAAGLGMAATFLEHPAFARALSALGSVYVLWLAVTFLRSAIAPAQEGRPSPSPKRATGFVAGVVVMLLNPKAYAIIAAMFSQFLHSEDERVGPVLAVTIVFTVNNLVAFVVWTLAGSALSLLFRGEGARRWIDALFAAILLGVAVWMAVPLFSS